MNELIGVSGSQTIGSVELVEQINQARVETAKVIAEKNGKVFDPSAVKVLRHNDFLVKIRERIETENALGISLRNFSQSDYVDSRGKTQPCYDIDLATAKLLSADESVAVSIMVAQYIKGLESALAINTKDSLTTTTVRNEWLKQSDSMRQICEMMKFSDDLTKRCIYETGIMIEAETKIEIIPESFKKNFIIGVDVTTHEGVAKVNMGGKSMILRDIGELFNKRSDQVTKALIDLGYQEVVKYKSLWNGNSRYYVPTSKGEKFCIVTKHKRQTTNGWESYEKIHSWIIEHIFDDLKKYFDD